MAFASHDEVFSAAAPEARRRLKAIQRKVESLLPGVSRCISYRMPAFRGERVFFYFAAFKNHIGIYPPVRNDVRLIKALAPYRGDKGNLSFPLDEPLPIALIGRVARALYLEHKRK